MNNENLIKNIIAIGSGKGGVGKSLISSLLAIKLKEIGYKVGILDADITGPSIQNMFGLQEKGEANDEGIIPMESKGGIKIVSVNMFLEDRETPTIWRGPMLSNILMQLYNDTSWGELDYLIVDMPPGTSDIAITLYQSLSINGVIIVTTPQDLVNVIVKKFYNMSKKMNIEILGLIENMSYLICDKCNNKINLFGESKVDLIAKNLKTIVIDKIPVDIKLTKYVDNGSVEDYDINNIFNDLKDVIKNYK
jgi:Mrp family chromosome partitioning ATPase